MNLTTSLTIKHVIKDFLEFKEIYKRIKNARFLYLPSFFASEGLCSP